MLKKNESKMRRTWTMDTPACNMLHADDCGQNIMINLIDALLGFECKFGTLFGHKSRSLRYTAIHAQGRRQ